MFVAQVGPAQPAGQLQLKLSTGTRYGSVWFGWPRAADSEQLPCRQGEDQHSSTSDSQLGL